jgi:heme A synthase
MPDSPSESKGIAACSAASLVLVLAVIAASAYIRLSASSATPPSAANIDGVRIAHRVAASLAAIAVLVLALLAWRARRARAPAFAALAVTLALSALGAATGTSPPPPAVLGNLLGGLALAALLARALGQAWPRGIGTPTRGAATHGLLRLALSIGAAQAVLGAGVALSGKVVDLVWLLAHVALGASLAILCGWIGVALSRAGLKAQGLVLIVLAALAPVAGTLAALIELGPLASIAHPVLAALLLAALAGAHARSAARNFA